MNGKEFTRKARRLARKANVDFRLEAKRGKGGHQTIYFDNRHTTVKTGDIGIGLLRKMLSDLGIDPRKF